MGRMVAWMIFCGVVVGVLIAVAIELQIETLGYADRGAAEVVGAFGRGAPIGGFIGVLPGVLSGIGLSVLTLSFRRLPESTGKFRITAVATCAGVLLVPAGLLALVTNYYGGVGSIMLMPTYFDILGIPLIHSVPFAALGAQRVAKTFSRRANVRS